MGSSSGNGRKVRTGKRSQELGRWAEDLLCKFLDFERVPGSGSQWPNKEDLVKMAQDTPVFPGVTRPRKEIAQVKATENIAFLKGYMELVKYTRAENARPRWFQVVRTPNGAYIFEVTLVRAVSLGLGGDA